MLLIKKAKNLFLTKANPLSHKRNLKVKNVFIALISILIAFLAYDIIFEPPPKTKVTNFSNAENLITEPQAINTNSTSYEDEKNSPYSYTKTIKKKPKLKKKVISQLLTTNKKQNLIGLKVLVELQGNLQASSQSDTPVRVKVIENLSSNFGTVSENSILIGRGRLDPNTQRLHINFTQLINYSGEAKSIQASAFMPDGSFGIKGKYSSGELKKYGSRAAGNFIGGLAQGLKAKTQTRSGNILELSSLKNALLSGLSLSALSYAQSKALKNQNSISRITILNETRFFVHF